MRCGRRGAGDPVQHRVASLRVARNQRNDFRGHCALPVNDADERRPTLAPPGQGRMLRRRQRARCHAPGRPNCPKPSSNPGNLLPMARKPASARRSVPGANISRSQSPTPARGMGKAQTLPRPAGNRFGGDHKFYWIFAVSGFSGLIYESIWTHYLKLFLGHAAYAQSLVLAIFMGGMALGSWACSRLSGRWRNVMRGYAVVEGAVGVLAILFHPVFVGAVEGSLDHVIPRLGTA